MSDRNPGSDKETVSGTTVLAPGSRVFRYEIVSELGRGGMAVVYRARDLRLERDVAIKIPRTDRNFGPNHLKRFLREARATAKLSHPSIVPVLDVFEHEGLPMMAVELIEGGNLRQRLNQIGPLPLDETLRHAAGLADALGAAHDKRILHRDVTPNNVLLGQDGRARLSDFGLAHLYIPPGEESSAPTMSAAETSAGQVVGTPGYMSPEQLLGKPVDPRSDLFSLGAVIYEMCAAEPAFRSSERGDLVDAILNHEPTSLSRLNYEMPEELERIVRKALAKRANERYQSAAEMLADLRALRRRSESPGLAPEPPPRPSLLRRSLPWVVGTAVLASVAFFGGRYVLDRLERPLPTMTSRQITSDPAWESSPALSPDGRLIAFASDRSGNADIWIVNSAGGEAQRLTFDPADDDSPAWFPDGNALAFFSMRNEQWGVWKVPYPGGSAVLLVPDAADPAISPDGRRIAFIRRDGRRYSRIVVADLDDPSRVTWLTGKDDGLWSHHGPVWSPDGRTICYSDGRDLWVVEARGGDPRRLTALHRNDDYPAWSPDGRHVYFSSMREGTGALWRVRADGTTAARITPGTGPEAQPSLSGGGLLAYSTYLANRDVVLVDLRSGERSRIEGLRLELNPAFAPDGRSLVFESDRDGKVELWLQPLADGKASGEPRRLTDQPGDKPIPRVSPDGRWIAFGRVLDAQRDVWIVPAAGGLPRQITSHPGIDAQPAWSPDGSRLAFVSDRDGPYDIWIAAVPDSGPAHEPSRLTEDESDDILPVWSPDGKRIAYLRNRGQGNEVWIRSVDDDVVSRLIVAAAAGPRWLRWAPNDPEALIVSGAWGKETITLRSVSTEDGAVTPFAPSVVLGDASILGIFDLSPDGTMLAYNEVAVRGDIWALETRGGSF